MKNEIDINQLKARLERVDNRIKALDREKAELADEHNAINTLVKLYGHRTYDPVYPEVSTFIMTPDSVTITTGITAKSSEEVPKRENRKAKSPSAWRKEILESIIAFGANGASIKELESFLEATYSTLSKHMTWLKGYGFVDIQYNKKYKITSKGRTYLNCNCDYNAYMVKSGATNL